jgi:tetratricopeptide (TPR) repeat protein
MDPLGSQMIKNRPYSKLLLMFSVATIVIILSFKLERIFQVNYFLNESGKTLDSIMIDLNADKKQFIICHPGKASLNLTKDQINSLQSIFNSSLKLAYRNDQVYLNLGRINCLLKKYERATEAYQNYINLHPDNPLGYIELGFAYEALGKDEAAYEIWQEGEIYSEDFLEVADQLIERENYVMADLLLSDATNLEPSNPRVWIDIARSYELSRNFVEAEEAYLLAYKLNEELSVSPLASYLKNQGEMQQAKYILISSLKKFHSSMERKEWYLNLSNILEENKDWNELIQVLNQAIIEFPNVPEFYYSRGWAYYYSNTDTKIALEEFKKAISIEVKYHAAYFAIAQILNKQGEYDEAAHWFNQAIELNPNHKWYQLARANNLRQAEKYNQAIGLFKETIEKFPDFYNAYYYLSLTYLEIQQPDQSLKYIKKGLSISSDNNINQLMNAAEILKRAGDNNTAYKIYENIIRLEPGNTEAQEEIRKLNNR